MVLLECKTENRNSQCEHGQPMEQTRGLFCMCDSGLLSITKPMSLPVNEFDVRIILHGQVSLAAVNQFYVIHEAMNSCKKSKVSLKVYFENVNIYKKCWVVLSITVLTLNMLDPDISYFAKQSRS